MAHRLSHRLRDVRWIALGVAAAAVFARPAPSAACMHEVQQVVDPRVQMLADAELDAAEGRLLDALTTTALAFPGRGPATSPLHERALLVTAKAITRSEGRFGWGGKSASTAADRSDNLTFAVAILEARSQKQATDTAARTDLAESLALLPARRQEAVHFLGELENRNVMASAHGYRALAKARQETGLGAPSWIGAPLAAFAAAPREMALTRCERMATTKSVCRA